MLKLKAKLRMTLDTIHLHAHSFKGGAMHNELFK